MIHCVIIRLKQEAEIAGKLKEEVRQISDTALHLQSQVKEVAQAKEKTQTAYQVYVCQCV